VPFQCKEDEARASGVMGGDCNEGGNSSHEGNKVLQVKSSCEGANKAASWPSLEGAGYLGTREAKKILGIVGVLIYENSPCRVKLKQPEHRSGHQEPIQGFRGENSKLEGQQESRGATRTAP